MSTPYNGNGTAPFVAGSSTSQAAATSINGSAATLRNTVLATIRAAGPNGMTCDEVEQALSMRHQTASARIRELSLRNQVFDSTRRRRTRSNRTAVVWLA